MVAKFRRRNKSSKPHCVYLLAIPEEKGNWTYVGRTNDFRRRIRQHNEEIKGGALRTKMGRGRFGTFWQPVLTLWGLPSGRSVGQLEWRLHHPKKRCSHRNRILARCAELAEALCMNQWTSKSEPTTKLLKNCFIRWNKAFGDPPDCLKNVINISISCKGTMHRSTSASLTALKRSRHEIKTCKNIVYL